jgi:hypothetical protein
VLNASAREMTTIMADAETDTVSHMLAQSAFQGARGEKERKTKRHTHTSI